jgi:hypothetical protein
MFMYSRAFTAEEIADAKLWCAASGHPGGW